MNLKNLAIGLVSSLGLGVAVGATSFAVKADNSVQIADASVTPGQWRLNILVNSGSWWLDSNALTVVWTGSADVALRADSDLGASDNKSSYSYTKVDGTDYYLATYEMSCPASSTTMYFKRYNPANESQRWGSDERSVAISSTCNTLKIDGSTNGSAFGNVFKVILHTGLNSAANTSFVKATNSNYVPANPSAVSGYSFEGWYTNSGKTSKYTASKLTGDLELWAKYTEDTYKVSVAGGSPISMTTSDHIQYTASITASAGQTVSFTKNNTNYSFTLENTTNNNYCANGFRFGGTFNIYLKTNNTQLWAAGMPTSATSIYHLLVNGINDGQMSANPNNASEVQMTGVHFNANDAINILNINNTSTYTFKNPNKNDSSVAGFSKSGNDIVCSAAGYYDLYYNFNSNSLYFGESSSSACVTFANNFLTNVGTNTCRYNEQTQVVTTVLSELQVEWVNQYAAWVALGEANQFAQGIMTNKSSEVDDELGRCVKLYDYIVGKYGSQLNGTYQGKPFVADFMGRNPAQPSRLSVINTTQNNNTTVASIALVASGIVTIVSVGGYFFLKKKPF